MSGSWQDEVVVLMNLGDSARMVQYGSLTSAVACLSNAKSELAGFDDAEAALASSALNSALALITSAQFGSLRNYIDQIRKLAFRIQNQ